MTSADFPWSAFTPSPKLLNDLAEIVGQLKETGVLETHRTDLAKQVVDLETKVAALHARHRDLLDQIRYATQAAELCENRRAEAVAGLKKLFAPLPSATERQAHV
jgi:hypothetical protein